MVDFDETIPWPTRIKRRLRYWSIKNAQDAFWMEEAEINGVRFDQLTVDLSSWIIRGFEVKVSRSDFQSDRKWQNYLPYVNQFYFATVPDVIKPEELPDGIGLLEYHDHSGILYPVKKAKKLQPVFLRRDLGSEFVIKLMQGFIRDVNWRASNAHVRCECGKSTSVLEARRFGSIHISL